MSAPLNIVSRSRGGGVITLSGGLHANADAPGPVTARLRFNSDGTVDHDVGAGYTQIAALTDWIIPNAAASSSYTLRATQVSADVGTKVGTMNTDLALSLNRIWTYTREFPTGAGTSNWVITFEIKFSGDSKASINYTLRATIFP